MPDIHELRSRLERMAEVALSLSGSLSDNGKPLTWDEKGVMKALKISTIQGIMEEATMFALTGNHEDLQHGVEQVHDWMELKY